MENKEKELPEDIIKLLEERKFSSAIDLAEYKNLERKLPEIYRQIKKMGGELPGYAARDCERLGYLSAAIKYNREEPMTTPRVQKDLKRLENWVLKSREGINDDNYYIPSLLLEDAEQTGNSIDKNFHKTKELVLLKGSPFIETLELLRYEQN